MEGKIIKNQGVEDPRYAPATPPECIAFNAGNCMRAAAFSGLDAKYCATNPSACAYCKGTWNSNIPPEANSPIASIAVHAALSAGISLEERQAIMRKAGPYLSRTTTPDDYKCVYRGPVVGTVICKPCQANGESREVATYACSVHGRCTLHQTGHVPKIRGCAACPDRAEDIPDAVPNKPRKLILKVNISPGDIMTLTAAIEALHRSYPKSFVTDVRTPVPAIFENNPWITSIEDGDPDAEVVNMEYPSINMSNQTAESFIDGYTWHLEDYLRMPFHKRVNRPYLYLSDDETKWMSQVQEHYTNGKRTPFWLINAGVKQDFTAKQWPVEHYQEVVNATRGLVNWVQIGELHHLHAPLYGVIDLVGHTDTRQLIRLGYHAIGGLGPVTFLQHIMAAYDKPYICILGGREPVNWVSYQFQHTLHSMGMLDCCRGGACWKSRVVPLGDGDEKDKNTCDHPVVQFQKPSAQCMAMITPDRVISIIHSVMRAG